MTTVRIPRHWPLYIGLAGLYGPLYATLSETLWRTEAHGHAPLIAVAVAWLFWQLWQPLARLGEQPAPYVGSLVLAAGLALAWLGLTLDIPVLAMASQLPVLAGCLFLLKGPAAVRLAAFPLLFLAFMIPVPGFLLESLSAPLKTGLSAATVAILQTFGYPAARSGIVIVIGQYQLLVAEACSGLHSLLTLSALGLLFLHLTGRGRRARLVLLTSLLPTVFLCNLLRIVLLALVTYHLGDEAGRAVHAATGFGIFLLAGAMLLGIERAVSGFRSGSGKRHQGPSPCPG